MLSAYSKSSPSSSSFALAAIRLTFNSLPKPIFARPIHLSCSYYSTSPSPPIFSSNTQSTISADPLNPDIPLSPLGLPLSPLPLPLPPIHPAPISREVLERLHRLSALNPPAEGSAEEAEVIDGIKGLVGLMEAVKAVELPSGGHGALLGRGVGELELDFTENRVEDPKSGIEKGEEGVKKGRELLEYATRRVGDYYASRLPQKT